MLEKGEYEYLKVESSSPTTSMDSTLTTSTRKNRKNKNKRRFSDAQIKSMENMFETESKLEPRTKVELAKELNLQPRQVAIWFQNRRARWKSKQLERDFNLLKANYDALSTQFESIKKEKQMLLLQLQKLNELGKKPNEESLLDGNSTDDESENAIAKHDEPEQKPAVSFEGSDFQMAQYSDDENNHNMYLGEGEEADLMNVMDPTNPILSSQRNWSTFNSDDTVLDESGSTSQWWEIWS
ncbi:hypothetical protein ACHQM5_020775 [Ranunculus cassubicifolius]